jgi:hypothetical protein
MGIERFHSHEIDDRVAAVSVTADALIVKLFDGRMIQTPLDWFPGLASATALQRKNWEPSGEGYSIHWPDIGEDVSVGELLRTAPRRTTAAA